MQLLTQELRQQLPPLYSQEHVEDPMVICKFFCPWNQWTWYALEFDGEDRFFGWVVGDEQELGYFLLSDFEKTKGPAGLEIERDLYFKPTPLSVIRKPPVTSIATATEAGQGFDFKVLASHACSSESAGHYEDFGQGKQVVEEKYKSVTWVTPYRFMKELTASSFNESSGGPGRLR
jgi:DUF2958 family protein